MNIELKTGQKAYFVSDAHFGLPNHSESLQREKLMVKWLDEIKANAAAILLVGDIFDFWWEYRRSVPRNFVRLMGKIAELSDSGVQIHFFFGNHDMWCRHGYFEEELGAIVHPDELKLRIGQKKFYIAHGDGLGPGDKSYKLLKWGFRNKFLQWGFSQLHPDFAQWLGHAWSAHRKYENLDNNLFYDQKEFLYQYSQSVLEDEHFDFFVYGHRHTPVVLPLTEKSKYVNTGDWLQHFSFGEFDGQELNVLNYPERENMNDYATLKFAKP